MTKSTLLLRAYYERLYEKLEMSRNELVAKADKILNDELSAGGNKNFDKKKYAVYHDVCVAFIDERLEAYNPTGIQYTFDNVRGQWVQELAMQLDWYDSKEELGKLLEAVDEKAESEMSDEKLRELADEIIKQCGAFPDTSIIAAYEHKPNQQKLPDYAVARAIEDVVR